MSPDEAKWRNVDARLLGWAAALVEGLTEEERRQAWLAGKALFRSPSGQPTTAPPLSVEGAFEAAVQRLRAAKAGDQVSALALERLVRTGYQADRDESLAGFTAGLDAPARQEVATLAASARLLRRVSPREAVAQALRLAYDRAHHPDRDQREESARTLAALLRQVEASPVLRHAVDDLSDDHLRALDDLLAARTVRDR